MLTTLKNAFKMKELRKKIFYTFAMLVVIRLGSQLPVPGVDRTYFSRWRIEEYFRCKKQMFQFENFRVRKLATINALNFYITLCIAFLAHMSMKPETHALKVAIIQKADPIK